MTQWGEGLQPRAPQAHGPRDKQGNRGGGAGLHPPGSHGETGTTGCSAAEATCRKHPRVADGETSRALRSHGRLKASPPQTHHSHRSFPFPLPGQAGAAFRPHPSQGPRGACRRQEARACETGPVWTLPPEPQRPCQPVRGPPPGKTLLPQRPRTPPPLGPPSWCSPRTFALLCLLPGMPSPSQPGKAGSFSFLRTQMPPPQRSPP